MKENVFLLVTEPLCRSNNHCLLVSVSNNNNNDNKVERNKTEKKMN